MLQDSDTLPTNKTNTVTMKKIYAVAVWLLMIGYAEVSAQGNFFTVTQPLGQGDVLLGGYVFANQSNFDGDNMISRQFRMSVSPKAQFFLSDDLICSIGLPAAFSRTRNDNDQIGASQRSVNAQVNLSPALKFIRPLGERVYLFLEGFVEIGWGMARSETQPQGLVNFQNQFLLGAGLTGGASFLINDHFLLEGSFAGLNYYWRNIDPAGGGRINAGSGFWLNPSRPTLSLSYRISSIN